MAATEVEIKTEPVDLDFTIIKEEELIIKPENDNESLLNTNQLSENELQYNFDLLIPKDEPIDEEYLTEDVHIPEHANEITSIPESSSPNEKFECENCKRHFTSARGLSSHKRLRCRNINICNVCGQVFRSFIILQSHLEQHRHQKKSPNKEPKPTNKEAKTTPPRQVPFKLPPVQKPVEVKSLRFHCKICNLSFRNSQSLGNHSRIHDGFNHICKQCGKSFKYIANIRKHMSGDTCVTEAIADVLGNSGDNVQIKEEVESDDSEAGDTRQRIVGTTIITKIPETKKPNVTVEAQGNIVEIKKEEIPDPAVLIKEEPVDIEKGPFSNDSRDYDELILQELIDRKAKSIARKKQAINGSIASHEKINLAQCIKKEILCMGSKSLDFEAVMTSNTVAMQNVTKYKVEKRKCLEESSIDDNSQYSISEVALKQSDDFEQLIDSNMLLTLHNKANVIESLKEEYQKAKKQKLDEVQTDESSQNSLCVENTAGTAEPSSKYFSIQVDLETYNCALRELDGRYRFTWVCAWCPRRYIQRFGFIKHLMNTHSKQRNELNNMLFELKPELFSASEVEDNHCHLCRVTLADATSLQKHRNEFHKEDNSTKLQFKCEKCGKFCSTRSTLADHVQANCGTEPQYGCIECGKKFYTKSTLNLHKTMHTGELPHQCTYCEKRFRTRGQLTVHTRTHTGERPFPCKVCERRFTHRETLIAHLSRHIDMKRYKCYSCDMFFSCISGLKTHRLTRMETCGKLKLNARPVGPRVRVIKGNVIFEPQPKINPYYRDEKDNCDENTAEDHNFQENKHNQTNVAGS